jgi:hypothetical protein
MVGTTALRSTCSRSRSASRRAISALTAASDGGGREDSFETLEVVICYLTEVVVVADRAGVHDPDRLLPPGAGLQPEDLRDDVALLAVFEQVACPAPAPEPQPEPEPAPVPADFTSTRGKTAADSPQRRQLTLCGEL